MAAEGAWVGRDVKASVYWLLVLKHSPLWRKTCKDVRIKILNLLQNEIKKTD